MKTTTEHKTSAAKRQFRFTLDKNGKWLCHEWKNKAMRFEKVSVDEAKLAMATGNGIQIYKGL